MKIKRIIGILAVLAVLSACLFSAPASALGEDYRFSPEYRSSPYYQKLIKALDESKDATVMERTLAAALSQEGYLNYSLQGIDAEQARADGLLWTGAELRMSSQNTGNTEYTRWAQSYLLGLDGEDLYADYDWCAIFASWCMYQAGCYDDDALKRYFYSYAADPRIFYDADSWLGSFNFDQHKVWYVPKAHHKLDDMDWNTYYNVDTDPYDIPYRPGGLVFFSWDGSGQYFDHVAIVVNYDADDHVLTYSNGNWNGQVATSQLDLDDWTMIGTTETTKSEYIMAYAEYDEYIAPEQREIHTESDVIYWDVNAPSGLRIQTDSQSVMASVYIDGSYLGSIIESNMIFHEGLLSIGRSELVGLSVGRHKMKLVFDDGEPELTLVITDRENMPVILLGDADMDGEVSILDATAIQRYLVGLKELSDDQLLAADADADGEVSIFDATRIQRYLAELPCPEGVGEPI